MSELKNCPICGSPADIRIVDGEALASCSSSYDDERFCYNSVLLNEVEDWQKETYLEKQVKILKEALEFYADKENWCHVELMLAVHRARIDVTDLDACLIGLKFEDQPERCGGKRARLALEEIK